MHLFFAEWKKIWKHKVTWGLLFLLLVFISVMGYQTYHVSVTKQLAVLPQTEHWHFMDEQGNTVKDGIEYFRFADKFHSSFQGQVDEAMIDRYQKTYQEIDKRYPRELRNQEVMNALYGYDYESFFEKVIHHELSEEELSLEMQQRQLNFYTKSEEENPTTHFYEYYEGDEVRSFYQLVMFGTVDFSTTDPLWTSNITKDTLRKQTLQTLSNEFKRDALALSTKFSNDEVDNLLDLNSSNQLYGNVIGTTLFVNNMGYINVLSLVVIAIVLSNSFAYETRSKTDQILSSSVLGSKHTAIAKITSGCSFAILVILLQYFVLWLISLFHVTLGNLNLLAGSQALLDLKQVTESLFTYQDIIGGMFVVQCVAAIGVATFTLFLSSFSKQQFASILVVCIILLGTKYYFLMNPVSQSPLRFVSLSTMMDVSTYFDVMKGASPYLFFQNSMISWRVLSCFGWLMISMFMMVAIYMKEKKHHTTNC